MPEPGCVSVLRRRAARRRTDASLDPWVGQVSVRWLAVGGLARIEVADDDPVLPERRESGETEELFGTEPPGSGTGLGLPLPRVVAEMRDAGSCTPDPAAARRSGGLEGARRAVSRSRAAALS